MGIGVKWPQKSIGMQQLLPSNSKIFWGRTPTHPTRNHILLISFNDPHASPHRAWHYAFFWLFCQNPFWPLYNNIYLDLWPWVTQISPSRLRPTVKSPIRAQCAQAQHGQGSRPFQHYLTTILCWIWACRIPLESSWQPCLWWLLLLFVALGKAEPLQSVH